MDNQFYPVCEENFEGTDLVRSDFKMVLVIFAGWGTQESSFDSSEAYHFSSSDLQN